MSNVLSMTKEQSEAAKAKAAKAATEPQLEPWVDVHRAAEHLGFSRNMVAKMAEEGRIPGVRQRNGTRTFWRFKLSLIDAALMGIPTRRQG